MNTYNARILADSLSPDGVRLTTFLVTFPRFILAEVNTHRVFSRNSASSRAIPPEKLIERVREHPFIPETFNRRVKGMGVGDALKRSDQAEAEMLWLRARDAAIHSAEMLVKLDVDKSRVNRLLEPWLWHSAIISSTEWANFFALRDHPAAQPEFQILARMMREVMDASEPQQLDYGWWHLPLATEGELAEICEHREAAERAKDPQFDAALESLLRSQAMVCAGRCARVSFDTHELDEPPNVSYERAKKLMSNGHFSPFEHVARPATWRDTDYAGSPDLAEFFFGNFRGWVQLRRGIPGESNFREILDAQEQPA